ncbi:hypothetical protein HELRODRAFT_151577, partial [Helobdella robusta]|uniref:AH domain-containing protein n=1 Tax=Helobdella robusta TaxID=6412 RepID=T1EKL2_HELRO
KTSDLELEKKVETLKDTQRQFRHLYDLARHLYTQYGQVIYTQKILGEVLTDLSHKYLEDGLTDQFNITATTQRIMTKNGEALLGLCLNVFLKSMSTLCNTTIEDTLNTVKELEASRLKYDAYRSYLEKVRDSPRDFHYTLKLQEAERNFTKHQAKYKRLHHDLNIKLKFLDENRIKVCQKHLHLFQRGFLCYINNNKQGMDEIMQQFN